MATRPHSPVVRYIHRIAAAHADHLTDTTLLDRFADGHDEEAFAILVRRHGRLVLGACRRIVHDWHAAEDCFQAVFLVLATKASTLTRTESLGPWLHAVATRVALKARSRASRRSLVEQDAADHEAVAEDCDNTWHDLRPILDAAINRLADKYRIPFVLCHLQGRTVSEIANQFGEPRGTVAARLARAREQLRKALTRRGVALSATSLGLVLGGEALGSPVPPALMSGTLQVARLMAAGRAAAASLVSSQTAALMEGAMRSMFIAKAKSGFAVLAIAALTTLLSYQAWASQNPNAGEQVRPGPSQATAKADIPALPRKVESWHEAHFQVFETDQDGVETLTLRPITRSYDNQTATIRVGEEIKVGDRSLFQGLALALTIRSIGEGKVAVDASLSRNGKVVLDKNGASVVAAVSQVVTTIDEGGKVELNLDSRDDEEPATRVVIKTNTYINKPMSEVEIMPTPVPGKPSKSRKN